MSYNYNAIDWVLFFYIYCFIGWCIESTHVSLHEKKFVNRGFMRSPFLPLYGSGAVVMLFVSAPVRDNLILTFIAGSIGATVLEYITGICMEALFKVRYWDYSSKPFNLNGQICLGTSIAWGFLTVIMVRVIHAPIEHLILDLNHTVALSIALLLTVLITADFALSFKAALDIKNILEKMTKGREELLKIQNRLDAIMAFSEPSIQKQDAPEKEGLVSQTRSQISELLTTIRSRFDSITKNEDGTSRLRIEQFKDELEMMKEKFLIEKYRRSLLKERLDFYKKNLLKNQPSATSRKFREAYAELKEAAEHNKKVNNKNQKKNSTTKEKTHKGKQDVNKK